MLSRLLIACALVVGVLALSGCAKDEPPPAGLNGGTAKTPPGVKTSGGDTGGKAMEPQ
jgi:hypothetical protein